MVFNQSLYLGAAPPTTSITAQSFPQQILWPSCDLVSVYFPFGSRFLCGEAAVRPFQVIP